MTRMMNEQDHTQVRKDMAEDYVSKLSDLLNTIDQCKQEMIVNPYCVLSLNERLHALYMKLDAKMNDDEREEEKKIRLRIGTIHILLVKRNPLNYKEVNRVINMGQYNRYKDMLEERELHLNRVMERVGLTAQQEKRKMRMS